MRKRGNWSSKRIFSCLSDELEETTWMVCLELNWSKFVRGQLVLSLRDWSGAVGVLYPLEVGQDGGTIVFFPEDNGVVRCRGSCPISRCFWSDDEDGIFCNHKVTSRFLRFTRKR